jgi:hypothetical protein
MMNLVEVTVTNTGRPRHPSVAVQTLAAAAIVIAACGGSVSPPVSGPESPASSGALAASGAPAASVGGGGGANAGIPAIADGSFRSGKVHVEVSGGKNETLDIGTLSGSTTGGSTFLVYATADVQKVVQFSFLAATESDRGAVTVGTTVGAVAFATIGTWGKECQVKITRNDAAALSGEFSCSNAPASEGLRGFGVNIKGTFSAER